MRSFVRRFVVLSLMVIAIAPAQAQGIPPARRAAVRAARQQAAAKLTVRDRQIARRAVMRERIKNMTPAQRQQLKASRQALKTERQRIGAQVRSGGITQEQGRQKMLDWRRAHRPNKNPGLRGAGPGEGEF